MGRLFTFGRLLLCGIVTCALGGTSWGDPPSSSSPDGSTEPRPAKAAKPKHVQAKLVCEQDAVAPGSTVSLGITFKIEGKWHLYWNGRNENGVPPSAEFKLPEGYSVGAIQWPVPVRHIEPGDLLNHVYFDTVTLIVPLRVPQAAAPGSEAVIKAHLAWMACEDACVAEQADVSIRLTVATSKDVIHRSGDAKAIDAAKARLPREISTGDREVQISWNSLPAPPAPPTPPTSVSVSAMVASHMTFYPYEDCVPFADAIKDADADGSSLIIRLGDPEKDHTALSGVLEIRRAKQAPVYYAIKAAPSTTAPGVTRPLRPTSLPPIPSNPNSPALPTPEPKPLP